MIDGFLDGSGCDFSTYRLLDSFHRQAEMRELTSARLAAGHYHSQYNQLVGEYNALLKAARDTVPRTAQLEQRVREQDLQLQGRDARIAELESALKRSRNSESFLRDQMLTRAIREIDEAREKERLADLRSQEG